MCTKLRPYTVNSILGKIAGGQLNITIDNVPYTCNQSISVQEQMSNLLASDRQNGGGKRKSKKKTRKIKSEKNLYKEFLDKKYSKEQLLKKCKSLGIKVTTRKNGMIKPIKKETIINKIIKIKFG
tara:strand:- start:1829 stop:2203 length:375 start_codon:yes stop_codon:yes gene_type:complete